MRVGIEGVRGLDWIKYGSEGNEGVVLSKDAFSRGKMDRKNGGLEVDSRDSSGGGKVEWKGGLEEYEEEEKGFEDDEGNRVERN